MARTPGRAKEHKTKETPTKAEMIKKAIQSKTSRKNPQYALKCIKSKENLFRNRHTNGIRASQRSNCVHSNVKNGVVYKAYMPSDQVRKSEKD